MAGNNGSMTKKFFSDNEGNPSSMRLMSMLALIVAAMLAVLPLFDYSGGSPEHVLYLLDSCLRSQSGSEV